MELQSSHSCKDLYASPLTPPPRRCTSFNGVGRNFYSAPTSPNKKDAPARSPNSFFDQENKSIDSNSDNFEFETSKKFRLQGLKLENSHRFDNFSDDDDDDVDDDDEDDDDEDEDDQNQMEEDLDPMPEMAFADDLFKNGLILPLPPRLQLLHPPSPKSPSSMLRFPYPRRSLWNDDYDPFSTALDKVSDNQIGKKMPHRRTQSFSPFRTIYSPQSSKKWNPKREDLGVVKEENGVKGLHRRTSSFSPFRNITPSCGTKGWNQQYQKKDDFDPFAVALEKVRMEKRGHSRHHRRSYSFSPLRLISSYQNHSEDKGYRKQRSPQLEGSGNPSLSKVRTKKGDQKKPSKTQRETNESKGVKGFLTRYASFGGDRYDMKLKDQLGSIWKRSFLRVVSFRVKQHDHDQSNTKQKVFDEPKMEVAHYNPGMALCLSFENGRNNSSSPSSPSVSATG